MWNRVKDKEFLKVHWVPCSSLFVNGHDDQWKQLGDCLLVCLSLFLVQTHQPPTYTRLRQCLIRKNVLFMHLFLFFFLKLWFFLMVCPGFLLHFRLHVQYEARDKIMTDVLSKLKLLTLYHCFLQLQSHDRERWKFTTQKTSFRPWKSECDCKCLLHFFGWNPTSISSTNIKLFKNRLTLFWEPKAGTKNNNEVYSGQR